MVIAALAAGGRGTRFGGDMPKQFLDLAGRPVIIRSLDAFIESGLVDEYVVAVGADFVGYTRELTDEYLPGTAVKVIPGGDNRNGTLMAILNEYKNAADGDIILTHDAVRPCIDKRIISDNIAAARKYGACNTVIPAVDTILLSADGEFIVSVPPRGGCFHAQTPQSFSLKKLAEIYAGMSDRELEEYTDACTAFVARGEPVYLVRGSRDNIKITFPQDIKTAEEFFR